MRFIFISFPKINYDDDELWLPLLHRGLHDILFSKLTKKHRDPAIKLVSSVIEVSDFDWCLLEQHPDDEDNGEEGGGGHTPVEQHPERGKFFLVILNLACIEVSRDSYGAVYKVMKSNLDCSFFPLPKGDHAPGGAQVGERA